jgi:L-ascorbate metabolism protein UlaG (beta-lactamase superfamily)
MGPDEAVEAVRLIEPQVAIPIHWGGYERIAMRADPARARRAQGFVDHVAELSSGIRAELLAPGSSLDL